MAAKKKDELSKLVSDLRAAGVKPQDLRKMVAASKTAPQTARLTKARAGLKRAKAAKRKFERSPEAIGGKIVRGAEKLLRGPVKKAAKRRAEAEFKIQREVTKRKRRKKR
jgi:hypothetical protein